MGFYKNILFETKDHIAFVTLNRPENRNAMSDEMKEELIAAIDQVERDEDVRTLVMTGSGKVFCAGGDIKKITKSLLPSEIREMMKKSQVLLKKLVSLEKPVIASVNGDAFGMGCNLALAADFIIVSERARFCEVFVKIGTMPDFGALYFLPRRIGILKTKELAYLGDTITAEVAKKIGLVNEVVAAENLESATAVLANRLVKLPTRAIARMKRLLNNTFSLTLEEVLEKEIESQIYLSKTEDYQEGIRSLIEKRKPVFKGK